MTLTIVTVVIANDQRLFHVDLEGGRLAEAVSGENHDDGWFASDMLF